MTLSKTTQYAIGSVLFFLGSVAVAVYTFNLVGREGATLQIQVNSVGQSRLQQEQHERMMAVLDETKQERETLRSYLLTEGKVINFLNDIETLARSMGITFSTNSLEVKALPNPQFESVELKLQAAGQRDTLVEFLNVLETLPYYSRVDEISMTEGGEGGSGEWSATLKLIVGLQKI